jgi:hypothetical protein
MDQFFPHTNRVEVLLRVGMVAEARRLHNQHVDEQSELAKSEPIDLSDLVAAYESFDIHEIEQEEAAG